MKIGLILSSIITIGVCFLSIWIFSLPAIWESWDLSNKGQIGDTIGGITSPIIGVFGTVLLYLSFKAQRDSISDEKEWNKKRLNSEILNFYLRDIKDEYNNLQVGEEKGMSALYTISATEDLTVYKNIDPILSILHSTKSFIARLEDKNLKILETDKNYFETAVKEFYTFKVYKSLQIILTRIDKSNNDELKKEIKTVKEYFDNYVSK